MSNQELVMQLCKLKGTVEALLDIIVNAAIEDNMKVTDRSQIDRSDINHLEPRARGPGTPFADAKHTKTLTGILQQGAIKMEATGRRVPKINSGLIFFESDWWRKSFSI
uniref:Uncharacterized protein n=1 Tax=Romanomermis culicivorax TaxID=13658 RepID=A0A915IAB3_ROMCU